MEARAHSTLATTAVAAMLLASSCGGGAETLAERQLGQSSTTQDAAPQTGGVDGPVIFDAPRESGEEPVVGGVLTLRDGCLGLTNGGEFTVVVWRFGATWDAGTSRLVDREGSSFALGQELEIGGSPGTPPFSTRLGEEALIELDRCIDSSSSGNSWFEWGIGIPDTDDPSASSSPSSSEVTVEICPDSQDAELQIDAESLSLEFEIPAAAAFVVACANLQRMRTVSAADIGGLQSSYPDQFGGLWIDRTNPSIRVVLAVVEGTNLDGVDEIKGLLSPLIVDEVVIRPISLVAGRELFQDLVTDLEETTLIGGAYDPQTGSFLVEIGTQASEDLVVEVAARADELFGDLAFRIDQADSLEGPG